MYLIKMFLSGFLVGLSYLREGKGKDKQLISRARAVMAVASPLPNSIPRTAGSEAEMIPQQRSIGSKNMLPGVYKFHWFDCATGKEVVQEKMNITSGDQSWSKPSDIGAEVAVYIKRMRE